MLINRIELKKIRIYINGCQLSANETCVRCNFFLLFHNSPRSLSIVCKTTINIHLSFFFFLSLSYSFALSLSRVNRREVKINKKPEKKCVLRMFTCNCDQSCNCVEWRLQLCAFHKSPASTYIWISSACVRRNNNLFSFNKLITPWRAKI